MKLHLVLAFSLISAVFATLNDELQRTCLENPDLFDGDMVGIDDPHDTERNAIPGERFRWPNATVPYVIDASLSSERNTKLIKKAMKHYHDNTCVRFVPRREEKDYVRFFSGRGCYSYVGRVGSEQPISLGMGCMYVGTVIHEIGHALGFYHEQNRSDRDKYLIIYYKNIRRDYGSIMIYGNTAFSKDGKSYTMEAKDGTPLFNPYTKQEMTSSDIQRVKILYKC